MWSLVEPEFLQWNLYVEPCGSGTFMWNLLEPELLTVEPLCGTLWKWNLYVEPFGT